MMHPFSMWRGHSFSFLRSITNHGNVSGTAWFQDLEGGSLVYFEEGVWTGAWEKPVQTRRSYEFLWDEQAETLLAYFYCPREGRGNLFLTLKRTSMSNVWSGEHFCGRDHYAAYEFSSPTMWSCKYRVRGPQKDYVHSTEFRINCQ